MEIIFCILFLWFISVSILSAIECIHFLIYGTRYLKPATRSAVVITAIILGPIIFLSFEIGKVNDCCSDSAFFAPYHRISILLIIVLSILAYFYSSFRNQLRAPVIELLVNCFLLIGFSLNVFMIFHEKEGLWLIGNVPVIALFLVMLSKNHQLLRDESMSWTHGSKNILSKACRAILQSHVLIKFPLLVILCLPLLVLISLMLFVFGQRPDSMIRAFTDTYKHGLSQLDYQCENVQCGGHYLCSVAANGHPSIVKPIRYGRRNGAMIICNRQLLVSNAFEELISQKFPAFHRWVRRKYDRVGDLVHRYYHVFNNRIFSDFIYLLMKPLEGIFLLTLYLFDRYPENRIAQQYLSRAERIMIHKKIIEKNKNYRDGKNA